MKKQGNTAGGRGGKGAPAGAFDLAKAVTYAKGSVVSRALAQKKAGTLTLFAFDEGEGLSEHQAPFDAWILVLDGEAEITVGGRKSRLKAGSAIRLPAGVPHALSAVRRFKMMLTMIREGGGSGAK